VRAKALLEAQDPRATTSRMVARARGAARFAGADGACYLPMPGLVGSGAKPAPRRP